MTQNPFAQLDAGLTTRLFLIAVLLAGLLYAGFGMTPSSYGETLRMLEAPDAGPVAGYSRGVRSDEWAVSTPFLQAAVRNGFRRFNETSFYHEDLRNFYALPLKDWALAFKPGLWAFFVVPPAIAFSIYYALLMTAFLAGYQLLFLRLGIPSWLAVAATIMLYFSGYTQFWWTSYGPSLAGLPWILLIVLQPMRWWQKCLLCAWVFPVWVMALVYPILLITLAWGGLILILATRPSLLRPAANIAAIAIGAAATAVVIRVYYADLIPVMRNTVYPGQRVSAPGTASTLAVFSELFPFLSFRLSGYQHLDDINICEIAAVGSFLPLLTVCLTRYRALRAHTALRNSLMILLTGFAVITLWEIAPVPGWIGRVLLWDRGPAPRWLFVSGLLLTVASLLIWRERLVSVARSRIVLFLLIGPALSLVLKIAWLMHKGAPAELAFLDSLRDAALCGALFMAGLLACYVPATARLPLMVISIVLANVYAFGRFNPLQPARPVFDTPDTLLMRQLRREEAAAPGGVLVNPRFNGAALNGLGFRSTAHVLAAPQLAIFRSYFPAMDQSLFNLVFNRFAHIHLTANPLPRSPDNDVIDVPMEVFLPVRNVRKVANDASPGNPCAYSPGGGIDRMAARGDQLDIQGWATWVAETDQQGIRILSTRALRAALSTVTRPDVAERLQDYGSVKAGFQLQLSATDGKPLTPEDIALIAFGTPQGAIRLPAGRALTCP